MIIEGKRALAWVGKIEEVKPIDGYDRVEYARILGWWCIVSKDYNLKSGDKVVYFEIDSKVPSDNPAFSFLEKRNYKIKTLKMCKVVSQGLIMPVAALGIAPDIPENTDLTEKLGVKYIVAEDNIRKQSDADRVLGSWKKNTFLRKLLKYKVARQIILKIFGATKDHKIAFPSSYVCVTDEERVQNMPYILEDKQPLIASEKIDGTSTTFLLVKKGLKYKFYCCSRNRTLHSPTSKYYDEKTDGVYWKMAIKYDVENQLKLYLKNNKNESWVCIQGETFGLGLQGNPLKQDDIDFKAFNFITSKKGRVGSLIGRDIVERFETPISWVPIVDANYILPDSIEELLEYATNKSTINNDVLREGIVFRSQDGTLSFKAVSPEYLLKKGE